MKKIRFILIALLGTVTYAQTGIGTTNPNTDARLEISATDKGLLMPRIALTGTASAAPLSAHVIGMAVYNTATVGDVTPGYYVNNGSNWVRIIDPSEVDLRKVGTDSHITSDAGVGGLGTSVGTGISNIFIGFQAGYSNTTGGSNNFIGFSAGSSNTTGSNNNFIGRVSGTSNTTGKNNNFIGRQSGNFNTTGSENNFMGRRAGFANTIGNNNTFIGGSAGENNTSGSNNIVLGYDIDVVDPAANNQLNIGNIIYGTGVDGVDGTLSTGNIGIGTNAPTEKLDVNGTARIRTLTAGNAATDEVVVADATGVLKKVAVTAVTPMVFSAEYAGAALYADGTDNLGFLTSDNAGAANSWMNFYHWENSETDGGTNDYDIILRFTLPQNFVSWESNAIVIDYSGTADANFTANVYLESSGTAQASLGATAGAGIGTWSTATIGGLSLGAGDTGVIVLKLTATDVATAGASAIRLGDITLNYKSKVIN